MSALPNLDHQTRQMLVRIMHSGMIGPTELRAADRFSKDYSQAVHGVKPSGGSGSSGGGPGSVGDGILFAIDGHRRAAGALGNMGSRVLATVIGDGTSIRELADTIGAPNESVVTGIVIAQLHRLSQHYADIHSR